MAAKTYYVASGADGNFSALVDGTAQTAASRTDGWTVAKTASGNSSEYDSGTKQTSGSFSSQTTTPKPANFLTDTTANAFKTPAALNGVFSSAAWTFTWAVRAGTASSQAGRIRMRVFKSANADGSGATELTGSTQVGTTSAALSTSSDATSTVTWTPGTTITLNNEYLFFVIAWEITTASGSNQGDVLIRTGSSGPAGSRLVTPNFSPSVPIAPVTGISATSTVSGSITLPIKTIAPDTGISATSTVSGGSLLPHQLTNNFEGGTDGTTITAANSGGTSGNAFNTVSVVSGGTLQYSNAQVFNGSLAARMRTGATSGNIDMRWAGSYVTQAEDYGRLYLYFTAIPNVQNSAIVQVWDSILNASFRIRINTTGKIAILAPSGSVLATSTTTLVAGQWYRIEWHVHADADINLGYIEVQIFTNPNGTTPDETLGGSGTPGIGFGTLVGRIDIGPQSVTNWPTSTATDYMYLDEIVANATAWVGPVAVAGTKPITPATISATSTVSGSFIAARPVTPAAISATSTVGGTVRATHRIGGAISATSTVSGSFIAARPVVPAAISATSTVTGRVGAPRRLTGAISATSTVSGAVAAIRRVAPAAISATSTVSGQVRTTHRISGAISATSIVSGSISRVRPITTAAISAASTVTGSIGRVRRITGATISATSTVTGAVVRLRPISGAISAASTVSGAVTAIHRLSGAISATSTVSGAVVRLRPIVPGAISATSTVSGSIRRIRPIATTTISATSTVAGVVRTTHRISGAISATSTVAGSIRIGGKISGATVSATSTVSGAVVVRRRIPTTTILATSTVTGAIGRVRHLSGAIAANSTVSGRVTAVHVLGGAISATSSVTGRVTALRIIIGAISATSSVTAAITRIVYPVGAISATSTVSGSISLVVPISLDVINAISTVSASIASVAPSTVGGIISAISTVSVTGGFQPGRIIYGKPTSAMTAGRLEDAKLTSAGYDEIPVIERAR